MIDSDSLNTDEFVDAFLMDIQPSMVAAGGGMTEVISHTGIFGIANIELSFEVECLPGFVGESCVPVCSTDPCSNNGTCLQSVSGFTCACRGDFTGETCETRINDCQDVDCNNGTCVDGVLSFTCQCDPGFTGDFCEETSTASVMATISTTSISDNTASSNNGNIGNNSSNRVSNSNNVVTSEATPTNGGVSIVGVVAGTAVGVVLLVAILIIAICIRVASGLKGTRRGYVN